MIKNYLFLCTLILSFALLQAQDYSVGMPMAFPQAQQKNDITKVKRPQQKAYGDTLYYEDFDSTGTGGIPTGWTISSQNAMDWIWSDAAPGGQYSAGVGPLQSTSSSNGFLSLPLDFYNSPFPPSGPLAANSYIQSPPIPISPLGLVILSFEQSYWYCCSAANDWVVEVSSDGISWTAFDNKQNGLLNFPSNNPELVSYDVSSVLANQSMAYIRFRVSGAVTYYFMVDDLLLSQGFTSAFEMKNYSARFSDKYKANPSYTRIPFYAVQYSYLEAEARNIGSDTLYNARLLAKIYHESTLVGGIGAGLVDSVSSLGVTLAPFQLDTFLAIDSSLYLRDCGTYRIEFELRSDTVNQNSSQSTGSYSFQLSDTVMAIDRGVFLPGSLGSIGPSNYGATGNDGDRWAVLYELKFNPRIGAPIGFVSTISIYVADNTKNINAVISPRIWEYVDSIANLNLAISSNPIGSSPFNDTIRGSDLGTWKTFSLFPPVQLTLGEQYLVGWEQISGAATGNDFVAGRDRIVEPLSLAVSNFVYFNNSNPGWGWVTQVAGVRLNTGGRYSFLCNPVGIEELKEVKTFSLFPNPTTGQFRLQLENAASANHQLKVRNALGQVVLEKPISGTALKNYEVDLTGQEKGLYFLSLESDKERWVEKLLLQ